MCTNHAARNVPACLIALWVFAVMLAPRDVEGSVVSRSREGDAKKYEPPPQGFKNFTREALQEHADLVLANMDLDKEPCVNFYKYACGKSKIQRRMPDVLSKDGKTKAWMKEVKDNMIGLLTKPVGTNEPKSTRLAKQIFQSCLKYVFQMQQSDLKSIEKLLDDLGGWPLLIGQSWDASKFDWRNLTYSLRQNGLDFNALFELRVQEQKTDTTTTYALLVRMAGPQINKFYFRHSHLDFERYLAELVKTFAGDKTFVVEDLKEVNILMRNISKIMKVSRDYQPSTPQYVTVSELKYLVPSIDWKEFLNNVLKIDRKIEDHNLVFVEGSLPIYLNSLLKLLSQTQSRTLANYMISFAMFSSQTTLPVIRGFKSNSNRSEMELSDKKQVCFDSLFSKTETFLTPAVASMYVKEFFDDQIVPHAKAMITNIQNSFKDIWKQTSWMDSKTVEVTVDKLDAMEVVVGYPDELMNETKLDEYYSGVDFEEGKNWENLFKWSRGEVDREFSKLWMETNKFRWIDLSAVFQVNAAYYPDLNAFIVFAAYFQNVLFDRKRPDYMNYGAMGRTIGHEISHGFDNDGIKLDKRGSPNDLWPKNMTELYLDRTKCFVEQYDKFRQEGTSYKVNGIRTLGENLADHGGALAAYSAYVKMAEQRGETEPGLPGLETLSPRQMFWVSLAQPFCGRFDREQDVEVYKYDPHSLPPFRVIGILQNLEQFSSDFNCPRNSEMNPDKKCSLWQ